MTKLGCLGLSAANVDRPKKLAAPKVNPAAFRKSRKTADRDYVKFQ